MIVSWIQKESHDEFRDEYKELKKPDEIFEILENSKCDYEHVF